MIQHERKIVDFHTGFETVGGLLLGAGAGFVQGWARGDEGAAARRRVPDKVLCFDVDLAGVVLCHPPTYVNKVLLGARDGRLELWNVRSGKRVHAYASIARGPGIAHVAASGALDVVAVARGTGRIQLLDARRDAVLFELDHGAAAAACCFCRGGEPRGAGDARPPVLVAAGGDQLRVWDLETRALLHVEKRVGGVAALHAGGLAGGPTGADAVVVTSVGADAKQWALDASDGAPRLCRRRDGLGGAPAVVRWYGPPESGGAVAGASGDAYGSLQLLVAAPRDRSLRCLHAVRDRLNGELSQRGAADARAKRLRLADPKALRLPPVTCVAAGDAKDGSFPNVVTCHRGERVARVWSLAERRLADHCLTQPHWGGRGRDDPGQVARRDSATACDLSACGNFALIGHEDGYVRKYNVQSGEARGTYPASLEAARRVADRAASVAVPGAVARAARAIARVTRKGEEIALRDDGADPRTAGAAGARAFARGKGRQRKHRGGVVGVHCDAANAWCVSCGGDAVKWWSFADHRARGALRVDAACAVTAFARASDLLAVGLDGGAVLVLDARPPDAGGGRVLRRLGTHAGRAARDLSWSATRQSLYAVCGRGALHRWDVASGACVDRVAFAEEAVAVSASPSGEFVATAHVSGAHVALWTDKAAYGRVDAAPLGEDAAPAPLRPLAPRDLLDARVDVAAAADDAAAITLDGAAPAGAAAAPLADGVLADAARRGSIRMSADPASSRARTETLYALEAVAERNRPVAPPKKPEAAPFFLPSEMDAQRRDAAPPPALPPPPPEDDAFAGDDGSDADGSDADGAVADAAAEASRCRLAALSLAEDATDVATHLGALGASALDAEIALLCRGPHDAPGVELVRRFARHLATTCVEIKFRAPTPSTRCCLRSCVCSMAWSFQAIDATLSPRPRRFDGVEVHKGPRNISQDNLTHWLISTQATTLETHGHFDAVQAYLHRLVQHHAAVLSLPQLRGPLATLAAAQRAAAARFRGLVHENLCLLEVATAD